MNLIPSNLGAIEPNKLHSQNDTQNAVKRLGFPSKSKLRTLMIQTKMCLRTCDIYK